MIKLYRNLLDRMRINPIPITNETKSLFQCLNTQQLFEEDDENDLFNYDISPIEKEDYDEFAEFEASLEDADNEFLKMLEMDDV